MFMSKLEAVGHVLIVLVPLDLKIFRIWEVLLGQNLPSIVLIDRTNSANYTDVVVGMHSPTKFTARSKSGALSFVQATLKTLAHNLLAIINSFS